MLVAVVEDGADVVQGVDGVVYCHHTSIWAFPDISGRYEICPLWFNYVSSLFYLKWCLPAWGILSTITPVLTSAVEMLWLTINSMMLSDMGWCQREDVLHCWSCTINVDVLLDWSAREWRGCTSIMWWDCSGWVFLLFLSLTHGRLRIALTVWLFPRPPW